MSHSNRDITSRHLVIYITSVSLSFINLARRRMISTLSRASSVSPHMEISANRSGSPHSRLTPQQAIPSRHRRALLHHHLCSPIRSEECLHTARPLSYTRIITEDHRASDDVSSLKSH